ncbi:DMT family transporter [Planktotalea sp.]|uniref:DMT family transporter n=1 Tax=Planktotalea sp. TaxID=2029877 RepID=UPI003297DC5D
MKRNLLSDYSLGVILIVAATIAYSTAGLFTKGVVAGVWAVIFWRGVFAVGFSVMWTAHKGTFRQNFLGFGSSGWCVAIIGALGTAAFIPAFRLTSIANVSLIYATAPLIAATFAWAMIGERITARTLMGCIGALLGVGIIVSGSFGQFSIYGDLLALIMTIAMALIIVIYRKYPNTPGAGPTAMQSILLTPVALVFGQPFQTEPLEILILAAFGLFFAIAAISLAEGAKRVPSGQTALLSALETPLAPFFAFILFMEIPGNATVLGGAIVLLAVLASINSEVKSDKSVTD